MITERPILFSAPMVRAIFEGRKTQTRRIVKPGKDIKVHPTAGPYVEVGYTHSGATIANHRDTPYFLAHCPYGKPGDRLWVREEHYRYGHWEEVPGVRTKGGRQKWKFVADTGEVLYVAPDSFRKGRHHKDPFTPAWHKRLARFMPRWASRITLEVESVRVERLQEISEEDCGSEGCTVRVNQIVPGTPFQYITKRKGVFVSGIRGAYAELWESINGPGSWDANPFVWCISFRKL